MFVWSDFENSLEILCCVNMSGLASALASLTASYTDSEDEDTTQEEEEKEQHQMEQGEVTLFN